MGASGGVLDATNTPHDRGYHGGACDASPMLFLFLEKNFAFDWKDNFCS